MCPFFKYLFYLWADMNNNITIMPSDMMQLEGACTLSS